MRASEKSSKQRRLDGIHGDSGTAELVRPDARVNSRRPPGRGDHGAKFCMGCKSSVNNCPR